LRSTPIPHLEKCMDLECLKIEHDMIDQHAGDLIRLTAGEPFAHAEASRRLADLADLVAAHLEKEDVLVYEVVARVRGRSAEQVACVVTALAALKADWAAYLGEWTADHVACRWAEFQRDTAAILPRLRARVREETHWLYPLALENGVLRLRVQQTPVGGGIAA
jgi:hypothetical protein